MSLCNIFLQSRNSLVSWKLQKYQNDTLGSIGVIPYQFTNNLHMTPSELDESWYVGSPGGLIFPKGITPPLIVWFPRYGLLKILYFVIFAVSLTIQSIIT